MKKILYVILGIAILYLILCIAGPSKIKIERSVDVNASVDLIKSKLIDYKFFHEVWSPWTEKDPNMKVSYFGETGKEGSAMSWESPKEEVGKGSMTYKYTHGDTVMESLHFDGNGDATTYHVVKANGASTNVSWNMENDVPFPARAIMLFMNVDKMVGPDFEKGLQKFKTAVEALATATPKYDVKELQWEAKTYFGKKEKLTFDKMSAFFGATYPKLFGDVMATKTQPVGSPKAIYFTFDEKTMVSDCAAVLEVAKGVEVKGWEKFETPASKVLLIEYYGAYDKSANAHYAMDAYMKEKGYTQQFVMEEYVTDPMNEKDTAKWLTNVFYLVK